MLANLACQRVDLRPADIVRAGPKARRRPLGHSGSVQRTLRRTCGSAGQRDDAAKRRARRQTLRPSQGGRLSRRRSPHQTNVHQPSGSRISPLAAAVRRAISRRSLSAVPSVCWVAWPSGIGVGAGPREAESNAPSIDHEAEVAPTSRIHLVRAVHSSCTEDSLRKTVAFANVLQKRTLEGRQA